MSLHEAIEQDAWTWIREFVAVPNEFYGDKFPPCPYARGALLAQTVDVAVWQAGDFRRFIREQAFGLRDAPKLTTRVMILPPRAQWAWGICDHVEALNAELIPDDVFLNTGVAKTTRSRYPGSPDEPYFIVVANRLEPVLKGAQALQRTDYYKDWPSAHYDIVVDRRARLAKRYRRPQPQ